MTAYWHHEGDLLCSSCWDRVEHLAHDVGDVIEACRAFHRGDKELVPTASVILADFGMDASPALIPGHCCDHGAIKL